MKDLNANELKELNGGIVCVDDVIFATVMLIVGSVLNDWDGFKKGFMSAFYF